MNERKPSVNDSPRFASPFHGLSTSGGAISNDDYRFFSPSKSGGEMGDRLGNYRLLTPIGSGQFGMVVVAEHVHLRNKVAVKIFQRLGSDADTLRAFERSATLLERLNHPNIVKVRDFGVTETLAYLAMDLIVPGVALDLMAYRMPMRAVVEALLQIAHALRESHSATFVDSDGEEHRGIFHGDVKPANVLIGGDHVYLTDFMIPNMSEFHRRDHGHPCFPFYDTRWYGTPMYMAPEQLQGVVNAQTDIFAFGVTAYELITGRYPWDSEDDFVPWHSGPRKPKPIRQLNDKAPEQLTTLVEGCIAIHPGERPISFNDIVPHLERILAQLSARTFGPMASVPRQYEYDVAISFAGSERKIAEELYARLQGKCRVFYDRGAEEKVQLWGSDLATHLHSVYSERTGFCVVLVSKEYVTRAWTNWERRAILQRMVLSDQYLLPVIIDEVNIPGVPTTIGALHFGDEGVDGVVSAVLAKVGGNLTQR